ncbi:SusD/RagB family nutrient-binding outer membrane lipoprotein [Flavobacterium succinicans]|uniref:Starch-binding associating with outer membrane n=1 Tax=Flavobacterium succinicans TaxID=29536 RepID=A0A199XSE2_9FLAO|nr:SusD/RagB family nutrient-binding outer membrane lipoprotein [Flavobacterium succinicans]OAZ04565.1 starch-binding associating with outer membrane [Flavobacterium succinicans]
MKQILLLLAIVSITLSCSSDITDMNVDPKKSSTTQPEYLFTGAQKALVDQIVTTSQVFRLFTQQWASTTIPSTSQYVIPDIPDARFTVLYRDVLTDLLDAKTLIQKTPISSADTDLAIKQNKLALIDVLEVYCYSMLVDTFGNVPYSQALDVKKYPLPAYDDAKTIYLHLISRLVEDAMILKTNSAAPNFGSADIIYGGNAASTAKWAKFANSLLIKLAVTISDVDPAFAATTIQTALAAGPLASNADTTKLTYLTTTGNQNPLYATLVTSNRNDFIPAEPFVAAMDAIVPGGDPRMTKYFVNATAPAPVLPAGRTFIGGTYGEANVFSTYSHITATLNNPVFPGTLFDYAELQFLLAEAAEKNLIPGGTAKAKTYYDAGITASMLDWGVTNSAITAYLTSPKVAYNNPQSGATYKEKIGIQSWFALYNRGFEAWTSYRRLDYPKLKSPTAAVNRGILTVPVRYLYPSAEQTKNETNYTTAASAIGGDLLQTKIFWDKY